MCHRGLLTADCKIVTMPRNSDLPYQSSATIPCNNSALGCVEKTWAELLPQGGCFSAPPHGAKMPLIANIPQANCKDQSAPLFNKTSHSFLIPTALNMRWECGGAT